VAVTDPKSGVVIPFPTRGRPERFKDRFLDRVDRWQEGCCLYCGAPAEVRPLPRSHGLVHLPLCDKHVRWAMATRRERYGKQARILNKLVLAWVRLRGGDRAAAQEWLRDGH
jgi:hypothetical protein